MQLRKPSVLGKDIMSPVLAKLTLLQCVGYFSIVASRFEIQMNLDGFWLPVNHLSFLDSA